MNLRTLILTTLVFIMLIVSYIAFRTKPVPTTQVTEAYYEGPHDGYGIYFDWSSPPFIRYIVTTPTQDALSSCVITVDGVEVARHDSIAEALVEDTFTASASARTGTISITNVAGVVMTWSYDVASEHATFPPIP